MNGRLKGRLLATDLDGTLLHTDKTISAYTVAVLEQCRAQGAVLCYATARAEQACWAFAKRFVPDIWVTDNGAVAKMDEKIVFERPLAPDAAAELNSALRALPSVARITAACPDGYFINFEPQTDAERQIYQQAARHGFSQPPGEKIYKYTVQIFDAAMAARLAGAFPALRIVRLSQGSWYSITHPGADKWAALRAAAAQAGIGPEGICAFGDDLVDVDMLRRSGVGIAMENAQTPVKAAADTCCGTCDQDSVARWTALNLL